MTKLRTKLKSSAAEIVDEATPDKIVLQSEANDSLPVIAPFWRASNGLTIKATELPDAVFSIVTVFAVPTFGVSTTLVG